MTGKFKTVITNKYVDTHMYIYIQAWFSSSTATQLKKVSRSIWNLKCALLLLRRAVPPLQAAQEGVSAGVLLCLPASHSQNSLEGE